MPIIIDLKVLCLKNSLYKFALKVMNRAGNVTLKKKITFEQLKN